MIDLTEEIMKKITTILLTLLLGFAMAGCTAQDDAGTPEDVINPTNLTFSLTDGTDNPDVENFTTIDEDPFIAEEGSTVLEATELYCMSHDMSITIEKNGSYVTEINGFTQGDYTDTTGWVFTVNGEMQLTPDTAAFLAMLFDFPFAFTKDLQPGGINHRKEFVQKVLTIVTPSSHSSDMIRMSKGIDGKSICKLSFFY